VRTIRRMTNGKPPLDYLRTPPEENNGNALPLRRWLLIGAVVVILGFGGIAGFALLVREVNRGIAESYKNSPIGPASSQPATATVGH
jgi:hypothetical protein